MSFRILPVCNCTAHDGDHIHIPGTVKLMAEDPPSRGGSLGAEAAWLDEAERKIRGAPTEALRETRRLLLAEVKRLKEENAALRLALDRLMTH